MARILTGIQSTGVPHLGNLLGAIIPAINLSKDSDNECLFFIADMHSFTTVRDPRVLRNNTYATAAAWLSFGFDTDKNIFYRQSDITEVCELAWYLNCFTPYPMLANSHSFKDKSDRLASVNAGLFTYPVLMAADILLYDAQIVPVGKDQSQHLEITRDLANAFNYIYKDTFIIPEIELDKKSMIVTGTDGKKMSKSYSNDINIFLTEKLLKKQIMSIKTDSIPLSDSKNPETCNVFKIYKLIANQNQLNQMKSNYINGNYGYGHAKNELLELILTKYKKQREEFARLMDNKNLIEEKLRLGSSKAKSIATSVLQRVRNNIGY